MKPAKPHRPMTRTGWCGRGRTALAVAAISLGGLLAAPGIAAAAPAPCERADRYAAETGAEALRINRLDGGSAGTATDVGLAEAKSALVAQSSPPGPTSTGSPPVNAAAVARILDSAKSGKLARPLIQQAPPSNPIPARRSVTGRDASPFTLGGGTLASHARWDPRMACARATGEVTRVEAAVSKAAIGDLVRVATVRSSGTTALKRGGETAATAGLTMGDLSLARGAVRVRVIRPPALTASMSTAGGRMDYRPPVLEVYSEGSGRSRLDTVGDDVEIALSDAPAVSSDAPSTDGRVGSGRAGPGESTTATRPGGSGSAGGSAGGPRVAGGQLPGLTGGLSSQGGRLPELPGGLSGGLSGHGGRLPDRPGGLPGQGGRLPGLPGGLLSGLPRLGAVSGGTPLPLPAIPGVPEVGAEPESAQVTGPGTRLRISLGDARQATSGHAIAARATAIRITIMQEPAKTDGYSRGSGIVLDLDVGVLEAAAVAPEPAGGVQGVMAAAGLPITGPRASAVALAGIALIAGGVAALAFGRRRSRN